LNISRISHLLNACYMSVNLITLDVTTPSLRCEQLITNYEAPEIETELLNITCTRFVLQGVNLASW
jgi:hypothetical protein